MIDTGEGRAMAVAGGGLGKPPRVLCFGDSLTAGYHESGRMFHPYASALEPLLGGGARVDHVGLSGWTAKKMASTLDDRACTDVCGRTWKGLRAKLLDEKCFTHCVILAGTNDVASDTAGHIFQNVWTLAKTASSMGCVVFVMTIPEMAAELSRPSIKSTRSQVNKLILRSKGSRLSSRSQHALRVIDLAPLVPFASASRAERDKNWEPDGLHLRPV